MLDIKTTWTYRTKRKNYGQYNLRFEIIQLRLFELLTELWKRVLNAIFDIAMPFFFRVAVDVSGEVCLMSH